jgi:hypothetical protein
MNGRVGEASRGAVAVVDVIETREVERRVSGPSGVAA